MLGSFKLLGPVGADVRISRKDTVRTKQALQRLGFIAPPEGVTPIADDTMLDGIKAFQKENGLVPDGAMKPGGPTEGLIRTALFEAANGLTDTRSPSFRVGAAVGAGAANRPADILATKRTLARVDIIPEDEVNGDMARAFPG